MLEGFPKRIITTKLKRGHYRIDRDDGYSIEVRSSGEGDWYQVGNLVRRKSLSIFKFDMERGYMAKDQIDAMDKRIFQNDRQCTGSD